MGMHFATFLKKHFPKTTIGRIGLFAVIAAIVALPVAVLTAPQTPSVLEQNWSANDSYCTQYTSETQYNDNGNAITKSTAKHGACPTHESTEWNGQSSQPLPLTSTDADLLAQERVAHWTAWIGGFTAAGLIALILTLIEAHRMTIATQKIGQHQTRAHCIINSARIRKISLDSVPNVYLWDLEISNVGQTPVQQTGICYKVIVEGGGRKKIEFAPPKNVWFYDGAIGTRTPESRTIKLHFADDIVKEFDQRHAACSTAPVKGVTLRHPTIFIVGKFVYQDVFGAVFSIKFKISLLIGLLAAAQNSSFISLATSPAVEIDSWPPKEYDTVEQY